MLSKLLKYDFKSLAKSLVPFYGLVILLGLLVRISGIVKEHFPVTSFINGMMLMFFIMLIVAILFYTFFVSIRRFYRNVLKDEGYLTNTLPVKRSNIILSQTITSFVFSVISTMVMIVALLVAFYTKGSLGEIFGFINKLFIAMEIEPWVGYLYTIMTMITGYMSYVLIFYLALILGHQRYSNKIVYSIVYGLVIYGVLQVLSLICVGLTIVIDPNSIDVMSNAYATFKDMASLFISSGILSILIPIGCYFLSCKFINTKLNLE